MTSLETFFYRGGTFVLGISLFVIGILFIPLGLTLLPVVGLFVAAGFLMLAAIFMRNRPFKRQVDVLIDLKGLETRRGAGIVPVAILTTSTRSGDMFDFDAATVDPSTVRLGPNKIEPIDVLDDPSAITSHLQDVDGDGDQDLVLHFLVGATDVSLKKGETCLTGRTYRDEIITGCLHSDVTHSH